MAYINTPPEAKLCETYNALVKYVKQYITGGNLRSKFDVFDREEVTLGGGIESNIILAATNLKTTASTPKAEEHALYTPKVFTLISTARKPAQYAVTVSKQKLAHCVGNREALEKYAAELVESLYQGWINDKNVAVAAGIDKLSSTATALVEVPVGDGTQAYADALLTQIKAQVEDLREGVSGTSYGNPDVGDSLIAADNVVILMSNATAALLDTYGYSKAFNENYLNTAGVTRVTTSRIPENTVIITDSRNIILHKRWEELVDIQNSDGSYNFFYNVDYFVDVATGTSKASPDTEIVGYPIKVIKGTETA